MIKKILAAWLIGLLCLSAALAEEAPGNPMLSPGEDNDDDRVISLDPDDYERPVTPFQLGLQESGVVPDGYFDDAVFVGDSITLKLYHYVKDMRNQGTPCLGGAKFLTAGSLGSGKGGFLLSGEVEFHRRRRLFRGGGLGSCRCVRHIRLGRGRGSSAGGEKQHGKSHAEHDG